MKNLFILILGGLGYNAIEILWRGYTHWTMTIVGGVCFLIIYKIGHADMDFLFKCILSALSITAIEFISGVIVNLKLHWRVWDYSAYPFNFMGQICLGYFLLWFALSSVILYIIGGNYDFFSI